MIDATRIQELLSKVPRPPEDAVPLGVTNEQCDDFEARTRLTLPNDVRNWLTLSNVPCVGPGGLYGIRPSRTSLDMESFFSIFPLWKTRKWIPVAGDGCGNHYVIATQQEYGPGYPVLFVDTSSSIEGPSYIVSSDLGRFLESLFEKELGADDWPFNKKAVVVSDPHILSFKGVRFPWTPE
jgi:cell wall assembly regulator SMI1